MRLGRGRRRGRGTEGLSAACISDALANHKPITGPGEHWAVSPERRSPILWGGEVTTTAAAAAAVPCCAIAGHWAVEDRPSNIGTKISLRYSTSIQKHPSVTGEETSVDTSTSATRRKATRAAEGDQSSAVSAGSSKTATDGFLRDSSSALLLFLLLLLLLLPLHYCWSFTHHLGGNVVM